MKTLFYKTVFMIFLKSFFSELGQISRSGSTNFSVVYLYNVEPSRLKVTNCNCSVLRVGFVIKGRFHRNKIPSPFFPFFFVPHTMHPWPTHITRFIVTVQRLVVSPLVQPSNCLGDH